MLKNNKKLYFGILIIGILLVGTILATNSKDAPAETNAEKVLEIANPAPTAENTEATQVPRKVSESQGEPTISQNSETESATVLAGEITLNLNFAPNTVFYDALIRARDEGRLTLTGKNYPGLGFFITDIGSLSAGGGKYLLYYINGKQATVGVSAYVLKNGDIIEWKLE